MSATILVVDDEASIRELLSFYLHKFDYQVVTAQDAQETLARVSEGGIAMVILDLVLPDADGMELLANLRLSHPELPVVMLTGLGCDEELIQLAEAKGAAGVVSKTLPLDQLLLEVRRVLYTQPAR